MSTKKITDLNLIDEAKDTLNFAADDTIQTYRVTAAQLKTYINEAVEDRLDLIEADGWVTKNRILSPKKTTRVLQTALTSDDSSISDLALSNLVIGKSYMITLAMSAIVAANSSAFCEVLNGTQNLIRTLGGTPTESDNDRVRHVESRTFIATATTINVSFSENPTATLEALNTYVSVEELPYDITEDTTFEPA